LVNCDFCYAAAECGPAEPNVNCADYGGRTCNATFGAYNCC
jgi:hypothetical protein